MANNEHRTGSAHPIPAAVARAEAEITAVVHTPTWSLRPAEIRDTVVALLRQQAKNEELLARLIGEGERNGAFTDTGAPGAAAWLAHTTRITRGEAHRHVKLAHHLEQHDTVRDGLAAGQVHADQAAVICTAVDELPEAPRELCEKELVSLADHYDAKALKVHGRRVLAIVDPEAADAHEAQLLEREEKDAAKATSLSIWETGDGKVKGRFTLGVLEGGMLKKALVSLAAPKHVRANGEAYDHDRPTARPHPPGHQLRRRAEILEPGRRVVLVGASVARIANTPAASVAVGLVTAATRSSAPAAPTGWMVPGRAPPGSRIFLTGAHTSKVPVPSGAGSADVV